MRALKKEDFNIKEGLDLYYSSPQDTPEALKAYLKKKEFPFEAFSKESQMNDEFSVYLFPTFVWLNSEGIVTRIELIRDLRKPLFPKSLRINPGLVGVFPIDR